MRFRQPRPHQIAGQYASRRAGRDRSFPELRAALAARLPRVADIADLGCRPAAPPAGQPEYRRDLVHAPDTQRWFFYREPAELDQQLRGAGLAVVTMTEEITSRHWLKILAEVA